MNKTVHNQFMQRCLNLASNGGRMVAPNPMVGAVLVYEGRIIGEGIHQKYGEAHAEVNCIHDAQREHAGLISQSVMYVSLEPCAHFGKTPPCADLIIRHRIPKVVIGCRDPFEAVNGRGIERLRAAGLDVEVGVMKDNAIDLNKRFFCFNEKKRPYIFLKWAQTPGGIMGSNTAQRLKISNEITNRLVHKWRSRESAILIGANTAILDDPLLDNRYWYGEAPLKIILDPELRVSTELRLFRQGSDVIVYNIRSNRAGVNLNLVKLDSNDFLTELMHNLYERKIQSVLVEGGRFTLQSLIDKGLWDEAMVITGSSTVTGDGVQSPQLRDYLKNGTRQVSGDQIEYFKNVHNVYCR
jgi:diaminohydroxyphosphoribosylaminopyrimidine deaminase/5-amino-6-(5-phosphoribosylamino)uracil reductase